MRQRIKSSLETRAATLVASCVVRRVLANEHTGRPRVVEVDVREEQVTDVAELEPPCAERVPQGRHAARRAAVEQRRAVVGVEQVRPDPAAVAEVQQVERRVCHDTDAIGG